MKINEIVVIQLSERESDIILGRNGQKKTQARVANFMRKLAIHFKMIGTFPDRFGHVNKVLLSKTLFADINLIRAACNNNTGKHRGPDFEIEDYKILT
jgi:hypothetical protein